MMELGHYDKNGELVPFITDDRSTLVIGKSGSGKSTLVKKLALNAIHEGRSVVVLDPRGDLVQGILPYIPNRRQKDVLLFEPTSFSFAFNPLAGNPEDTHPLVAETHLNALKGMWEYGKNTPLIDLYFETALLALLPLHDSSLLSLKYLLTQDWYRNEVLEQHRDLFLKDFWNDFQELEDKEKRFEIASTLNKVWKFLLNPTVRKCIDQERNNLVFEDKIVLVSLKKSELGSNAALLGALVQASIAVAGARGLRTDLFIDGAVFATSILGKLLEDSPNITTVLTLQYLDQLSPEMKKSVLGSFGQTLAFKTSVEDADVIEKEFNLSLGLDFHLYELKPNEAYVAIDGVSTQLTMSPHEYPRTPKIKNSKYRVEERIVNRCKTLSAPPEKIEKRFRRFFRG